MTIKLPVAKPETQPLPTERAQVICLFLRHSMQMKACVPVHFPVKFEVLIMSKLSHLKYRLHVWHLLLASRFSIMLVDLRWNFWKSNKGFLENTFFLDIGHALNHDTYALNLYLKNLSNGKLDGVCCGNSVPTYLNFISPTSRLKSLWNCH